MVIFSPSGTSSNHITKPSCRACRSIPAAEHHRAGEHHDALAVSGFIGPPHAEAEAHEAALRVRRVAQIQHLAIEAQSIARPHRPAPLYLIDARRAQTGGA